MANFAGPTFAAAAVICTTLLIFIYKYFTKNHDYWKVRNVPYLKPDIFFGNFKDRLFRKISFFDLTIRLYNAFDGQRFGGIFFYRKPSILIRDLDLIDKILVTDFDHFYDRVVPVSLPDKLLNSLFHARGAQWRAMRHRLTPTFTSAKLKGMFGQLVNCGLEMVQNIKEKSNSEKVFDVLPVTFKFANDVVASCTFGFVEPSGSPQREEFLKNVRDFFNLSPKRSFIFALAVTYPWLTQKLGLRLIPKSVEDYFQNIGNANMKYRKHKCIHRNDFLQLVMTLKEQEENGVEMVAGESRTEEDEFIDQMKYVPQDAQTGLKVKETLRLYTIGTLVFREVVKPYLLPGTDLILEPGTPVFIPAAAIHRDPRYYPQPERFLPDRFQGCRFKPSTSFLPFGHGPRSCVAMQFAILEVKVCLARVVSSFTFTLDSRTILPVKVDPRSFFPKPLGGLWLNFHQRTEVFRERVK